MCGGSVRGGASDDLIEFLGWENEAEVVDQRTGDTKEGLEVDQGLRSALSMQLKTGRCQQARENAIAEKRTDRSAADFHQTSHCDVQKVDGLGRSSQNEALEVPRVGSVVINEHLGQSDPSHPDALDGLL